MKTCHDAWGGRTARAISGYPRWRPSGVDHLNLTYRYAGRDFRLTDVHGEVVHDIVA